MDVTKLTAYEKATMKFSLHNALWIAVVDYRKTFANDQKKIINMWETAIDVYLRSGKSAYDEFKRLISCCLIFVIAL